MTGLLVAAIFLLAIALMLALKRDNE